MLSLRGVFDLVERAKLRKSLADLERQIGPNRAKLAELESQRDAIQSLLDRV